LHGSELLTCSITELGFVRVAAQATAYGFTVAQAQTVLSSLKTQNKPQFKFISDAVEIARLPSWVKTPNQTTDGHLLQLAKASGAALATFDRGIPGAFLIP
jgi:predicted nucleic acid-binding protein